MICRYRKQEALHPLLYYCFTTSYFTILPQVLETRSSTHTALLLLYYFLLYYFTTGIGNKKLYTHCHVGTKDLIENYNEELLRMLHHICLCRSSISRKISSKISLCYANLIEDYDEELLRMLYHICLCR